MAASNPKHSDIEDELESVLDEYSDDDTDKSDDDLYKDALDFLNLDDDEVSKKSKIGLKASKNVSDNVLKVNRIAESFKNVLEGKEFDEENNEFVQSSTSIAGSSFIRLSYGLLNSFSESSNLVTKKDINKFNIQFEDAFRKVNSAVLLDRTITDKDARMVIKLFKDKLCNIGDIITNTNGNMRSLFDGFREDGKTKSDSKKDNGVLS